MTDRGIIVIEGRLAAQLVATGARTDHPGIDVKRAAALAVRANERRESRARC